MTFHLCWFTVVSVTETDSSVYELTTLKSRNLEKERGPFYTVKTPGGTTGNEQ